MTLSQPDQAAPAQSVPPFVAPLFVAPRCVMAGRYRKRAIEIDAARWFTNGDHPDDAVGERLVDQLTAETYQRREGKVVRYFRHPDIPGVRRCLHCLMIMHVHGWIDTLEGGHVVCPGDWIVTGVHGERYPVKSDIFAETYELVSP